MSRNSNSCVLHVVFTCFVIEIRPNYQLSFRYLRHDHFDLFICWSNKAVLITALECCLQSTDYWTYCLQGKVARSCLDKQAKQMCKVHRCSAFPHFHNCHRLVIPLCNYRQLLFVYSGYLYLSTSAKFCLRHKCCNQKSREKICWPATVVFRLVLLREEIFQASLLFVQHVHWLWFSAFDYIVHHSSCYSLCLDMNMPRVLRRSVRCLTCPTLALSCAQILVSHVLICEAQWHVSVTMCSCVAVVIWCVTSFVSVCWEWRGRRTAVQHTVSQPR